MSEITKLYENAGIEKKPQFYCDYDYGATCPNDNATCDNCGYYEESEAKYPDFTAEKQLRLIKWLGRLDGKLEITCTYNKEKFIFYFYFNRKTDKNPDPNFSYSGLLDEDFDILIAKQVNELWQDLTAEEQQQIKEILNE